MRRFLARTIQAFVDRPFRAVAIAIWDLGHTSALLCLFARGLSLALR
jgi:hypothetical protein